VQNQVVIELVFSGATALAGLILVFLGSVLAAFESYEEVAKSAVRSKYRWRARLSLGGFLAALLAAGFAFGGGFCPIMIWIGVGFLVVAVGLTLFAAIQAVIEI